MSCEDLTIALTEAAVAEQPEPALAAHVEECAGCRGELAALRATVGRVRAARPSTAGASTPTRTARPGRAVLVALALLAAALALPALLAGRGPADRPSTPAPSTPEPSPADPRLLDPDAATLLARADAAQLEAVLDAMSASLVRFERDTPRDTPPDAIVAAGSFESTELLIARLDGPTVERALERLAR